ncbi:Serine/threonine-protein phosphatase 4 regulatory subunit 2 [Euphorbia peplus]|nr:Serine/threonine-protein phosphatase 4 regulatory subunit 2 [Euphorbia peplus]
MAMASSENSDEAVAFSDHIDDNNTVPTSLLPGDAEPKAVVLEEDVISILQVIASTGKFWHDWNKLKSMISFHLKQVLADYPEAKMSTREEQNVSLRETYPELVNRLDEALQRFHEGPPFTLQRLCEILLAARSIYPNLSKLALALEKNLLVTSTITISMDPYPPVTQRPEADKAGQGEVEHPQVMQNGVEAMTGDGGVEAMTGDGVVEAMTGDRVVEAMAGDRDEIMAEVDDDMTIDMEAFEDIVGSSDPNSTATATIVTTSPPNS